MRNRSAYLRLRSTAILNRMGTKSYIYRGTGDLDPLEAEQSVEQPLTPAEYNPPPIIRTERGTFAPGHSGSPGAGRPLKAAELDRMLKEEFPPEYIAGCIREVLEHPERQDYAQVLIYTVNRIAGTPVQKVDVTLPEDDIRHQVAAARLALLTALIRPASDANAIDADYKELPEGQNASRIETEQP